MAVVALALYVANEVDSIAQIVPAVAAMVGVQALIGVAQVVGQESLGLRALGEYALDPNVPGVSIIWTENEPKLLRAYGLADHPNILGGLLGVGLLLLATGFIASRPFVLSIMLSVFALGAVALLLTFSRAAMLGFGAGLALVFALLAYRRDWSRAGVWLGACLAALLFASVFLLPYAPYLISRANPSASVEGSTEARSLSERDALAKNANEIFIKHPLTGAGAGALPIAMREEFPDFGFNYQPAHFALLDVAAETGLLGAFFYGALMVVPWALLWLRRHLLTPELIGLSGALLAVYTLGLFDYYTWSLAPGLIWFWATLGLWLGAYRRSSGGVQRA
jgi:O-antigen ligase